MITGGTGSLGRMLVKAILSGQYGMPESVTVFSRDELKQHDMRLEYLQRPVATDESIYNKANRTLRFVIGDVRDYQAVCSALKDADVVFHAAALKQVPTLQYFPWEGVLTNILSVHNLVQAIAEHGFPVETVLAVSSDKACEPVNAYGCTKSIQESMMVAANLRSKTRWVCVRYGNVLGSRGSVIPLFKDQIAKGGPLSITTKEMTRFWLSLDQCIEIIMDTLREARPGEIYVPMVKSSRVYDLARLMIGDRPIEIEEIGVRLGEKIHETLVSSGEVIHTIRRGKYYVVLPVIPELYPVEEQRSGERCKEPYSSSKHLMTIGELAQFVEGKI